mmetsp:Transcript_26514/g.67218  ORF Transcript_26514/g.67218 Transcript_26514/m.67218 type:complete len:153 (+) Transcript_26514:79-537(+)
MTSSDHYDHAQRTSAFSVSLGLSSGAVFAAAVSLGLSAGAVFAAFVVGAVLLLAAQMMRELRVSLGAAGIHVGFALFGLPSRTLAWTEVASATKVRNSWQTSWGMHSVRRGWLWNIAGPDAVELELRTGRVFRIGTDDADGLLAACKKHLPR